MILIGAALWVAASYLIGSIPVGYLVARSRRIDIFSQGSGNVGATNVGRVLGRRYGILVFVLDFLKGALPAAGAALWEYPDLNGLPTSSVGVAAGLATLLGHLFPIYLRFRGGKGVATGAGVVGVLLPVPFLIALAAWITVFVTSRYVSLASIFAAIALALVQLFSGPLLDPSRIMLNGFALAAALLVMVRHRENILRLFRGNENRVKEAGLVFTLNKILHVWAIGLWFGTTIFFTFVVGLSLFGTFEELTAKPKEERPPWLPLPSSYDRERPSDRFPEPLRKEQGSRIFGATVGPMFIWYFGIQAVCGLIGLATAFAWTDKASWPRARLAFLILALLTVAGGIWIERRVEVLRDIRASTSDVVLLNPQPLPSQIHDANEARADFGRWHTYSLVMNFAAIGLVTAIMALTAFLPGTAKETTPPIEK